MAASQCNTQTMRYYMYKDNVMASELDNVFQVLTAIGITVGELYTMTVEYVKKKKQWRESQRAQAEDKRKSRELKMKEELEKRRLAKKQQQQQAQPDANTENANKDAIVQVPPAEVQEASLIALADQPVDAKIETVAQVQDKPEAIQQLQVPEEQATNKPIEATQPVDIDLTVDSKEDMVVEEISSSSPAWMSQEEVEQMLLVENEEATVPSPKFDLFIHYLSSATWTRFKYKNVYAWIANTMGFLSQIWSPFRTLFSIL